MRRMLFTSMVCGTAIAAGTMGFVPQGLMGDDRAQPPVDLGQAEAVPGAVPAKETIIRPEDQPQPAVIIRKAVPQVAYEDRPVAGNTTQRVAVIRMVYEDKSLPLPADEEQEKKLRDELKALRQQRIDALSPEDLVKELEAERAHRREQESWTKLQALRKQLKQLMADYPETMAARTTVGTIQIIPETDHPVAVTPTLPTPTPAFAPSPSTAYPGPSDNVFNPAPTTNSLNPLPTY